jgi:Taurine catabolism dioxygenase TauD, TfdA family
MTASAPMPPGPLGGSFAWQAEAFRDYDSWALHVTASDIAEIEAAAAATRAAGLDIRRIDRNDFPLPGFAARLGALRQRVLDELGFGYVRGLPVERWDADFRMRVYWGLSRHIGDPVPQNRNGHLIGHVIDIGTAVSEVEKRLTQTNAELSFHVDSCDVVGLFCLATSMSGGESAIVSGVAVHDEMMRTRPELCAALYGPIPMDRRGEVPAGGQGWYEMPLFHWHSGSFTGFAPVRQYVDSVRRFPQAPKVSPLLREALDVFYDLCADPRFCLKIPFRPGDIQYLHNHVVFHARTAYLDHPPPTPKRHLMRMWLSAPDGRELPPALLAKWPAIARGARRGGAVISPDREWIVPLEPETPAY